MMILNSYRFGGGAAWSPANLASLAAWWDASDSSTITESGGAVSQWDDKSGNANNLTQSTASSQPIYNGVNNTITFDSINDLMQTATGFNNYTGALVFVFNSDFIYSQADKTSSFKSFQIGSQDESGLKLRIFNYDNTVNIIISTNTLNAGDIIYVECNGTNHIVYINGMPETMVPNIGTINGNEWFANHVFPFTLGSLDRLNPVFKPNTENELLYTNAPLSTADRQKSEGYLAHKWGLTANLPAGHPYKTVAP